VQHQQQLLQQQLLQQQHQHTPPRSQQETSLSRPVRPREAQVEPPGLGMGMEGGLLAASAPFSYAFSQPQEDEARQRIGPGRGREGGREGGEASRYLFAGGEAEEHRLQQQSAVQALEMPAALERRTPPVPIGVGGTGTRDGGGEGRGRTLSWENMP
jgi:hypothetical protein